MAKLEKLIAYMHKLGIVEDAGKIEPASYRIESWSADYFDTAKISKKGVIVAFDYSCSNYHVLAQKEKMLTNYCNRYGFKVFYKSGFPGCFFLWVMPASDHQELTELWQYEEYARNEVEQIMHEYHTAGTYDSKHGEMVAKIKAVMADNESAYFEMLERNYNIVKFTA